MRERDLTYPDYLASPWWRMKRALVIRYRGERCERCGSSDRLQLHHRTYARLFRELPDDVELLCDRCHRAEHGIEHDKATRWQGDPEQIVDALAELIAGLVEAAA